MEKYTKDISIKPDEFQDELLLELHIKYLLQYGKEEDDFEYAMTESLRLNAMFWGLTAMDLMNQLDAMNKDRVLEFINQCFDPNTGGYRPCPRHDVTLLSTLSALQILCMYDELTTIDADLIANYIKGLQNDDGSFSGDKWGEVDTRFSFCAVASLYLLRRMDAINMVTALNFILRCLNFDGGFGVRPGSETHSAQVYCSVGFLAVTKNLHLIDQDKLGWWLAERQLNSGGFNGRPEKLPDVCYSWWVLASLCMINRMHWIDSDKLFTFIRACQDGESGGFADRPGNMVDPFHTLFGLAASSLLEKSSQLKEINPILCMCQDLLNARGFTDLSVLEW